MKKIKYLLFGLFLFLISITSVSALDITEYERNESNNYGVNKNWNMTNKVIRYAKETPYVDASQKIYDYSDILTDEEERLLKLKIDTVKSKYNFDIVILTYELPYFSDSKNEEFATDFYDFNDFGLDYKNYDGVILFRNTYSADPYYAMYSFGDAQVYLTTTRIDNILDTVYYEIHSGQYLDGFNNWINLCEQNYSKGKANYHLNREGRPVRNFNPHIFLNLLITTVVTIVFVSANISKNKMVVKKTEANEYYDKESLKMTEANDKLISSHTSVWTESSSSGGRSGGHSHVSRGHSGGFHSGGGRHG